MNDGRGGVTGVGAKFFKASGVISVTVLAGSVPRGLMEMGACCVSGVLPAGEACGDVALDAGILPNSTTADLTGVGAGPFFVLIISSAFVGIRKLGAFNIGCGMDSDWSITGFGGGTLSAGFTTFGRDARAGEF